MTSCFNDAIKDETEYFILYYKLPSNDYAASA